MNMTEKSFYEALAEYRNGEFSFLIRDLPFKEGYFTRLYVFGDIHSRVPLLVLHGGPGGDAYALEVLSFLSKFGIPVIFYNQFGSELAYRRQADQLIKEKGMGLFSVETFVEELRNVLDKLGLPSVDLLGHSWGGMLLQEYLIRTKDTRVRKAIFYSTLPSSRLWDEEHLALFKEPLFTKEEIKTAKAVYEDRPYDPEKYKALVQKYNGLFLAKRDNFLYKPRTSLRDRFWNKECYNAMWGPDEIFSKGTLKTWDVTEQDDAIEVPSLILYGEHDESDKRINETLHQHIHNSTLIEIPGGTHSSMNEKPFEVLQAIESFIR